MSRLAIRLPALLLMAVFLTGTAHAAMIDYPIVKLRSLDKTTARTMTFEARVGSTVRFGNLYIRVQACRKPPPIEKPESASFLQIWETDLKTGKPEWVFSGWMFASSPALSAMDHAIYDVWVLDCIDDRKPVFGPPAPAPKDEPAATDSGIEQESLPPPAVP